MSVKQFNGMYFQNDDRILFRFNTIDHSEYKLWLTRRLTHFILMTTGQFLQKQYEKEAPTVAAVISEFQSDKEPPSFTNAYEPGDKYPIGADAVLVINIRCEMATIEAQEVFSVDFILPGGGNINLKLPIPSMQKLILILEELNILAKWGNPASTFHKH